MQGGGSILALSPSFNSYSSTRFAEIAAKVSEEFSDQKHELGLEQDKEEQEEEEQLLISSVEVKEEDEPEADDVSEDEDEDDDEFEFAVISRDPTLSPTTSADEIFSNGQIKPIYPVFNRDLLFAGGQDDFTKLQNGSKIRLPLRKLLIEEREPTSSSSSESDELEGLPDGTYCVWTPKPVETSPEMKKKSNSTGSSKRWRFRDLLHRSNSDGKDTYVFLTPTKKKGENVEKKGEVLKERRESGEGKDAGKVKPKGVSGEASASAHEAHYVRNRAIKEGDRRRSYLPYRQDLVGLFANVNGLNRTLRPF